MVLPNCLVIINSSPKIKKKLPKNLAKNIETSIIFGLNWLDLFYQNSIQFVELYESLFICLIKVDIVNKSPLINVLNVI